MDLYTIVLRLFHIFGGVFWFGSLVVYVRYLEPAAKATATAGQQFMQQLMMRQKFGNAVTGAAVLNVAAGILLYLKDSGGLQSAWITTPVGLGFTTGAVLGITALTIALLGVFRPSLRLQALAGQIASAGGPPTPEQAAELNRLNQGISQRLRVVLVFVTLALAAMATARYW